MLCLKIVAVPEGKAGGWGGGVGEEVMALLLGCVSVWVIKCSRYDMFGGSITQISSMRHVLRPEPERRQVQFCFQVVSVTCVAVDVAVTTQRIPWHTPTHTYTHMHTHTQSSVRGIYLYLSMYIADYAHKWFIYLFTYCQCQWREFFHDAAATCSPPLLSLTCCQNTHTHNTSACPHEFQFELQLRSNLLDICRWTHSQ